jgi:hypothetical protein
MYGNAQTVALLPIGWNIDAGSRSSAPHTTRTQNQHEGRVKDEVYARTHGAVAVAVDVEYPYGALEAHALLGDAYDLLVIVGKGYALHRRRELPHEEALARLHGPESHFVVRGSRNEEAGLCCV